MTKKKGEVVAVSVSSLMKQEPVMPPADEIKKLDEGLPPIPPMRRIYQDEEHNGPMGLMAKGVVMKRCRKRVGELNKEVVTYTLGPRLVEVEVWEPASYWAMGEMVEVEVAYNVFQGKVQFRQARMEEVF